MRLVPSLALAALIAAPASSNAATAEVADREGLSLTVYQGGFALVEESRRATLVAGTTTVHLPDVSEAMIAASAQVSAGAGVNVRSLGLGGPIADTASLLSASVGREIGVVRVLDNGQTVTERARILRAAPEVIAEINGKIHVGLPGQPVFDALPPDLPLLPGLSAVLDGTKAGTASLTLRYLTRSLSWTADHVLTLAPGRTAADLTTWATLRNGTRQAWTNATLAVVAGDIRLPDEGGPPMLRPVMARAMSAPVMEKASADGFEREATDGMHVYRLGAPLDLAGGETRQVRLLGASALPISTVYEDEGMVHGVHGRQAGVVRSHPATKLVLRNAAGGPLGAPLPAGPLRVYAADGSGATRFVGGASLDPVPVGEEARVEIGKAFDLTVERTQTAFQRLGDDTTESAYSIVVRNGGVEAATVRVIETLSGDWQITQASAKAEKVDASRAAWSVSVPAKGKAEITFTARTRF